MTYFISFSSFTSFSFLFHLTQPLHPTAFTTLDMPQLARFLSFLPHLTLHQALNIGNTRLLQYEPRTNYHFKILATTTKYWRFMLVNGIFEPPLKLICYSEFWANSKFMGVSNTSFSFWGFVVVVGSILGGKSSWWV